MFVVEKRVHISDRPKMALASGPRSLLAVRAFPTSRCWPQSVPAGPASSGQTAGSGSFGPMPAVSGRAASPGFVQPGSGRQAAKSRFRPVGANPGRPQPVPAGPNDSGQFLQDRWFQHVWANAGRFRPDGRSRPHPARFRQVGPRIVTFCFFCPGRLLAPRIVTFYFLCPGRFPATPGHIPASPAVLGHSRPNPSKYWPLPAIPGPALSPSASSAPAVSWQGLAKSRPPLPFPAKSGLILAVPGRSRAVPSQIPAVPARSLATSWLTLAVPGRSRPRAFNLLPFLPRPFPAIPYQKPNLPCRSRQNPGYWPDPGRPGQKRLKVKRRGRQRPGTARHGPN